MQERELEVVDRVAGMRADVFLAARFGILSRTRVRQAIREGLITSDRRQLKPASLIQRGETLTLRVPELCEPEGLKPSCPPVVHEDPRVLVFDKPSGLLMHPVGDRFTWGLINLAREAFPDESLHLAHRLDRETSGICLVARDEDANRHFKAVFKSRDVSKTYLAVVRGVPEWDTLRVDAPIGDDRASPIRLKMGVVSDGQPALTELEVVSRSESRSLIRCRPRTGRTHQIRVHLDHVGFPILGDKIYGQDPAVFISIWEGDPLPDLDEILQHPRHCLHAAGLRIRHPDGQWLEVGAPLPPDMELSLTAP